MKPSEVSDETFVILIATKLDGYEWELAEAYKRDGEFGTCRELYQNPLWPATGDEPLADCWDQHLPEYGDSWNDAVRLWESVNEETRERAANMLAFTTAPALLGQGSPRVIYEALLIGAGILEPEHA